MSNKKISQLNSGGSLLPSDWYPIRRGTANYYLTGQMVIDACLFDDSQILAAIANLETTKLNLNGSNGPMLGNLDMGAYRITSTGVPSLASHLVNKQYVDTKFLPLSGGTLTGFLTLHANPVNPLHAATKQYVDQLVATITSGAANTNQLPEGTDGSATGLGTDTDGNRHYFTGARFDSRFATKTTDNLSEGAVNKYFTTSRFDLNFNAKTTDNLIEGTTNQYFTNNRARTALSAVGPILYNSATGVFTFDNSVLAGVTFGGATRIPFMNPTADDFIYSAGLTYDGTKLTTSQLQVSTYTFPTNNGTYGQYLQTDGNGTLIWANVPGFIDGAGAATQFAYFIDSNTIESDSRFKHEASTANFRIVIDNSSNPTVIDRSKTTIGDGSGFSQLSNQFSQLTIGSNNNSGYYPILWLTRGRGDINSATQHLSGDTLGVFRINSVDVITGVATENGSTGWGQNVIFKTSANGVFNALTEVMRLQPNGKLRIANLYDLPKVDGTVGQVLTTDGFGTVNWNSIISNNIYNTNGTLTGNRVVTLGTNNLSFEGTGGTTTIKQTNTSSGNYSSITNNELYNLIRISNSGLTVYSNINQSQTTLNATVQNTNTGCVVNQDSSSIITTIYDTNLTNVAFRLDILTTGLKINNAYTLPKVDGALNQFLKTNGNGTLSWDIGPVGPQGPIGLTGANGLRSIMNLSYTGSLLTLGTGTKTLPITTPIDNLGWQQGSRIRIWNSATTYMEGQVTSVITNPQSSNINVNIDHVVGTGSYSSWYVSITGDKGSTGTAGLGFNFVGGFTGGDDYAKNDVVSYNGDLYICILDVYSSYLPNVSPLYWSLYLPKGANGTNGVDAVWNFTGAYSGGAAYAVGDIATYNGQTWYRLNSNGGNVGDTPSEGIFWTLIAQKGDTGNTGATGATGATGSAGPIGPKGLVDVSTTCIEGITTSTDIYAYVDTSSGPYSDDYCANAPANRSLLYTAVNDWYNAYVLANPEFTGNLYIFTINQPENYLKWPRQIKNGTFSGMPLLDPGVPLPIDVFWINPATGVAGNAYAPTNFDTAQTGANPLWVAPTSILYIAFINESHIPTSYQNGALYSYHGDNPTPSLTADQLQPTLGWTTDHAEFVDDYTNHYDFFKGVIYPAAGTNAPSINFLLHAYAATTNADITLTGLQTALGPNYSAGVYGGVTVGAGSNVYQTANKGLWDYGWTAFLDKSSSGCTISFTAAEFTQDLDSILYSVGFDTASIIDNWNPTTGNLTLKGIKSSTLAITTDAGGCIQIETDGGGGGGGSQTLAQTLALGNSAGTYNINLNNNDLQNVDNTTTTTLNINSVVADTSHKNLGLNAAGRVVQIGNSSHETFVYGFPNGFDNLNFFNDGLLQIGWDAPGNDVEVTMLTEPAGASDLRCLATYNSGTQQNTFITTLTVIYDIYGAGVMPGSELQAIIVAETDLTYPIYEIHVYNASTNVTIKVTKTKKI